MNRAQRKLVGAGAVVAALLGFAAVREMTKPGANCHDRIDSWISWRGSHVHAKTQVCD